MNKYNSQMNFNLSFIKIEKFNLLIFSFLILIPKFLLAQVIEPEAVPGEYLVKLKPNYSMSLFSTPEVLESSLNSEIKRVIPSSGIVVVQRAAIETQKSSISQIGQSEFVEYVEPNYIYRALNLPNDLSFNKQWALKSLLKNGVDIGAEAAWDMTTGSNQIIVGIVDSGLYLDHPDIKANLWTNEVELLGKPGVDDDKNGYVDDIHGFNAVQGGSPTDDTGHGSHCAGSIGATGNDGLGITGVNWNVKLMPLKFLGADGVGTLEAAVKAIDYGVKMGARILSNSWGAYTSSKALQEAIERANSAGVLFVAAAGNDGGNNDVKPMFPASHSIPNIISVAAVDEMGSMAGFSNWSKNLVHLAAPGVAILGIWKDGVMAMKSGTSMAAPFVSGVAALILSKEPALSHLALKERILKTARPLASLRNRTVTGGLVNAYYATHNLIPPIDQNDPANWTQSIDLNISSEHPYKPQTKSVYEVKIPGAQQIAVYFSKFQTEYQIDQLKFTDKNGKTSFYSGERSEGFSRIVKGDYIKIEFSSDVETEGYGFDIIKAAYR